jgi:hypothetical protein
MEPEREPEELIDCKPLGTRSIGRPKFRWKSSLSCGEERNGLKGPELDVDDYK